MNVILRERRDKIGEFWYVKVNPLDLFRIESDGESTPNVYFQDLAIKAGYETRSGSQHEIFDKIIEPSEGTNQFVESETRFAPPDDQVQYEIAEIKREF